MGGPVLWLVVDVVVGATKQFIPLTMLWVGPACVEKGKFVVIKNSLTFFSTSDHGGGGRPRSYSDEHVTSL